MLPFYADLWLQRKTSPCGAILLLLTLVSIRRPIHPNGGRLSILQDRSSPPLTSPVDASTLSTGWLAASPQTPVESFGLKYSGRVEGPVDS